MPAASHLRLLATLTVGGLALSGCGGSASGSHEPPRAKRHALSASPVLRSITVSRLGTLPSAVMFPAVASLPDGRVVLLGGLTASDTSTDSIVILSGGSASQGGTLPNPQHDAQAASIGSSVYVFGGGQLSDYDHILRYDPAAASASQVGSLPAPASDVGVTAIGNTAYVIGGYNGTNFLDTIIAYTPGAAPRVVDRLPYGVRYAAVAAAGSRIIIAGGTVDSGPGLTDQILSYDTAKGVVSPLGRLPVPLTHATAAYVDGRVLVVGGRRQLDGDQTSALLAIDPNTGAVSIVGHLPQPLSDAGVALSSGRIIVAGGDQGNGAVSSVLALRPQS